MKVLFIISNSETAFWLSEVTHPYWHLVERGVEVDDPYVIKDGKLVTGQNQQSASEYALVLLRTLSGKSPVTEA
jgi:putative intracellular protease/amidase